MFSSIGLYTHTHTHIYIYIYIYMKYIVSKYIVKSHKNGKMIMKLTKATELLCKAPFLRLKGLPTLFAGM